jgi:hypothetical protein
MAADTVRRIISLEGLVSLATKHFFSGLIELLIIKEENDLEKFMILFKLRS